MDRFKQYNDAFGHPAGDEVLRTVAHLLCDQARGTDVVVRYGGEEFAVLLPDTSADGARVVAERIRAAIENAPWTRRNVTVSVGAATRGLDMDDAGALLARADAALYHAKNSGRNRAAHDHDVRQIVPTKARVNG